MGSLAMEAPPPDHVIAYGPDPLQFGHLRLPAGDGPFPVVLFVHGGCWLSSYRIGHVGLLEEAWAEAGYAARRLVGTGGRTWHRHALEAGARGVELLEAPESGHFEMIVPGTSTWPLVTEALAELFRRIAR